MATGDHCQSRPSAPPLVGRRQREGVAYVVSFWFGSHVGPTFVPSSAAVVVAVAVASCVTDHDSHSMKRRPMMALRPGGKACYSVLSHTAIPSSPSIYIRLPSHCTLASFNPPCLIVHWLTTVLRFAWLLDDRSCWRLLVLCVCVCVCVCVEKAIDLQKSYTAMAWPTDERLLLAGRNELVQAWPLTPFRHRHRCFISHAAVVIAFQTQPLQELFDVTTRQGACLMTTREIVDENSVMIADETNQLAHVATSSYLFSVDYRSGTEIHQVRACVRACVCVRASATHSSQTLPGGKEQSGQQDTPAGTRAKRTR
jgi:hypothetical protein